MGRFHPHDPNDPHHHHDHDHEHGVGDHSGYETGGQRVEVLTEILGENDRTAAANRVDFAAAGVRVVNVMSSPGAGKTTLLAEVFSRVAGRVRVGVVEGDIETSVDADRLAETGVPVSLVNTSAGFGGECHLDATMVRSALGRLDLDDLDVLVIENVGNLVCPAEFDVGEDQRLMVWSVTEGEEVVNKVDLLPYLSVDMDRFRANLADINPHARVLMTSATTGEGVDELVEWFLPT